MKRIYIVFTSILLLLSCDNEELIQEDVINNLDFNTEKTRRTSNDLYASNQMVIQYDASLTEAEKQAMRNQYNVVSFKKCECADPTLELWIFAKNTGKGGNPTIEEKVLGVKEDTDIEGVDFNRYISQTGQGLLTSFGTPDMNTARQKIVSRNENVTIAVLDTGIDYNYFGFTNPFLYKNENSCSDSEFRDYYGWDFVNQDNDPFDDHGHGTIVSNLMYTKLTAQNVSFQILPVKVFNEFGRGNYFDILCGFQYAVNNRDVAIINMSFGWYHSNYEILNKLVLENQNRVLITASAGNKGINTDFNVHYPSTYESNNILSVASLYRNMMYPNLASFSNLGNITVDIAARGEDIPFYLSADEYISVSGTSFSNAYATALCGKMYTPQMSVEQLMSAVITNTIPHDNLSTIKYGSYIPY